MSSLLARRGETVHVVARRWRGAEAPVQRSEDGRLVIHRLPVDRPGAGPRHLPHRDASPETARLLRSAFPPQAFSWAVAEYVERLVAEEGIDVVEAPEYEAPLYYFQVRRALGLGPDRRPPCVIHLHSPTETIVRHNGGDLGHPANLDAKRLEDLSIRMADALLCPSRSLAGEVAAREDLGVGSVRVIPYPAPQAEQDAEAGAPHADGPVVYVGRLERRKGTLEWLEAAAAVARLRGDVRFELVGGLVLDTDWTPGERVARGRIPGEVQGRFRFHGPLAPGRVRDILRGARLAVVPSRWDNLPNTCIEAMELGVPVLVTPRGGMVELVEDGVSGWVARDASPAALAAALCRALDTPREELVAMGRAARAAVRERCDAQRVLGEHLAFKAELVGGGPQRSLRVPSAATPSPVASGAGRPGEARIGVVLVCPAEADPSACIDGVRAQTRPPLGFVVARYGPAATHEPEPPGPGFEVLPLVFPSRGEALRAGLDRVARGGEAPAGVVVLDPDDRLRPRHLERCGAVLQACPGAGLVSFWEGLGSAMSARPFPARPYNWLWNDAAAASVLRVKALDALPPIPPLESGAYERWMLANAVLASGWAGVTVPEWLADRVVPGGWVGRHDATEAVDAIHAPFASCLAEDAPALVGLTRSGFAGALRGESFGPREYAELALRLAGDWRRAVRWAWGKTTRRMAGG